MKQSLPRNFTLAIAVAVGALALVGCESPEPAPNERTSPTADRAGASLQAGDASILGCEIDPTGAVAFVASARGNQPTPRLSAIGRAMVTDAFDTQAWVAVVSSSAEPRLVAEGPLSTDAANSDAIADDRARAAGTVESALQAAPMSPEADLIGAMTVAQRWLVGHGGTTLVVADSGLSTSGTLDYRAQGLLGADPDEVAAYLDEIDALPDLTGMTVIFTGLGDVVAPQATLSESTRRHIVAQYATIATKAGAACVAMDPTPNTGPAPTDTPSVSTVESPTPPAWSPGTTQDVVLTDDVIRFQPGTAKLLDTAAAVTALQSTADGLRRTSAQLTLTGTTADWGSPAYQKRLSLARANAIRTLLVRAGIDRQRITTRGVGSQNEWHVPDHDAAGHLLPGPASTNRTVRIHVEQ